ncbi:MAG: hypothetical protein AB1552_10685 [Nitrospirota bacterium]
MESGKKLLTRRELFREMVSKDTFRQVAGAWYSFTQPLSGEKKKDMKPNQKSLFEKVQRLNSHHVNKNGKEG